MVVVSGIVIAILIARAIVIVIVSVLLAGFRAERSSAAALRVVVLA